VYDRNPELPEYHGPDGTGPFWFFFGGVLLVLTMLTIVLLAMTIS
jgi:hypothetical protein